MAEAPDARELDAASDDDDVDVDPAAAAGAAAPRLLVPFSDAFIPVTDLEAQEKESRVLIDVLLAEIGVALAQVGADAAGGVLEAMMDRGGGVGDEADEEDAQLLRAPFLDLKILGDNEKFTPFAPSRSHAFNNAKVDALEPRTRGANNDLSSRMKIGDVFSPGPIHAVLANYSNDPVSIHDTMPDLEGMPGYLVVIKNERGFTPPFGFNDTISNNEGLRIIAGDEAVRDGRARAITAPGTGGRYSTFHCKFMLLAYDHGLRLVVTSMNLVAGSEFSTEVFVPQDFPWVKNLFDEKLSVEELEQLSQADDLPHDAKVLCDLLRDPLLVPGDRPDDRRWLLDWALRMILSADLSSSRGRLVRSSPQTSISGMKLGLAGIAEVVDKEARLPAEGKLFAVATSSSFGLKKTDERKELRWASLLRRGLLGSAVTSANREDAAGASARSCGGAAAAGAEEETGVEDRAAAVAAVAAGAAAAAPAPPPPPPSYDFATVYALLGSLFDPACAGIDHAAALAQMPRGEREVAGVWLRSVAAHLRDPAAMAGHAAALTEAALMDRAAAAAASAGFQQQQQQQQQP